MRRLYTGNIVYGKLPRGCELCLQGFKTVVFVTGICPTDCFYCPLSRERRGVDVVLANERKVEKLLDILSECLVSGSRGASLTGGDPVSKLDRSISIIRLLKDSLGDRFHVHMYTTGLGLNEPKLTQLERAGLDEIRLHPPFNMLRRLLPTLTGRDYGFDIGFELPVLPGRQLELLQIIQTLDRHTAIKFVNLNELEFSDSNAEQLKRRGYQLSGNWKTAVGSREAGEHIIAEAERVGLRISLHFCPADAKDRYQTGLRYYRRAVLTAKPHELVSDEGLILKALVDETCTRIPPTLARRGVFGLETHLVLAEVLGSEYRVLEEAPTHERLLLNIT